MPQSQLPAYSLRLKDERAQALYVQVVQALTRNKRYRGSDCSEQQLAQELQTDTRCIAAAVVVTTGKNYASLVNSLRLSDACRMLRSVRYATHTAEEIGLLSGFASRQSFYNAFRKAFNVTPRAYRLGGAEKKA